MVLIACEDSTWSTLCSNMKCRGDFQEVVIGSGLVSVDCLTSLDCLTSQVCRTCSHVHNVTAVDDRRLLLLGATRSHDTGVKTIHLQFTSASRRTRSKDM